ncbi:MAG: DUF721 domain-containing protein [Rickettsiales bacterium]|jgi:hypothetical protein|nr:DUF721 domain-containing protein [Rickettsiales bacterium]
MSNQHSKFSERVKRPITLAGAFGSIMKILGRTASDSDLAARWDEIMGDDIATAAKMVGLSRGRVGRTLTVRAVNPAAALTLSYMTDEIKTRANKYFGFDAVGKVTVRK